MLKHIPFYVNTSIPPKNGNINYRHDAHFLQNFIIQLFQLINVQKLFKIESIIQDKAVIRPRLPLTQRRDLKIVLEASNRRYIKVHIYIVDLLSDQEYPVNFDNFNVRPLLYLASDTTPYNHIIGQQGYGTAAPPAYLDIQTVDEYTTIYYFGSYSTDLNFVLIKTKNLDSNEDVFSIITNGLYRTNVAPNPSYQYYGDGGDLESNNTRWLYRYICEDSNDEIITQSQSMSNNRATGWTYDQSSYFLFKGGNVFEDRILYPFSIGKTVVKNMYYMDGGDGTQGCLTPTKCLVDGVEYYNFFFNVIAVNNNKIAPITDVIPTFVIPPIIIQEITIGDGGKGAYFIVKNTNVDTAINLKVYINKKYVKTITAVPRGGALSPSLNIDGVDFTASTTFGYQAHIIKGNPGDKITFVFSQDQDLDLLKYISINDVYEAVTDLNLFSQSEEEETIAYKSTYSEEESDHLKINPDGNKVYYYQGDGSYRNARIDSDGYGVQPCRLFFSSNRIASIPTYITDSGKTKQIKYNKNNQEITMYCTIVDIHDTAYRDKKIRAMQWTDTTRIVASAYDYSTLLEGEPEAYQSVSSILTNTNRILYPYATDVYHPMLGATAVGYYYPPEAIVNLINLIYEYEEEEYTFSEEDILE